MQKLQYVEPYVLAFTTIIKPEGKSLTRLEIGPSNVSDHP
jgi:hypothetical protein